jgi:major vault protein
MPAENRDFPISPDSYCYLQNIGSGGVISVKRGPTVVSLTGQDQPVRYDANRRTFTSCNLENAVQQFPRAGEGDYVVIENPSKNAEFPTDASSNSIELRKGSKIVIPGPWSEALWPGQIAHVVEGHRLRSNQYLIAIIYNADEAEKNWETGTVVKPQTESEDDTTIAQDVEQKGLPRPESFAVGTRIIIKGTDVSFYIPCTGVEVMKDEENGKYVREAVTLAQMEYCCLIDESGKYEYPKGPQVVFPKPTQVFDMDKRKRRKFRPLELNTINGVHLKVTADFEGEDLEKPAGENGQRPTRKYKEGEELFVTGKTLAIYYPREELAIIEYGQGNKKHFSTAIPKGEGRYLIDRETGVIELIKGPKMLLPDPRNQILVRRILSPDECESMYPGNQEALAYNLDLAQAMQESPSGRSGLVSEGDYRKRIAKRSRGAQPDYLMADETSLESMQFGAVSDDYEPESVGTEGGAAKAVQRGTRYTEPRQLTLNTKYDGVPKIEVFPGYAVLVVGSEGSRRVVEGPKPDESDENFMFLLEYDEKLGSMRLSTGKPKNTDRLLRTSYLCVANNQVGDIIGFESKDHVRGTVKISMRVNFEADSDAEKLKWFSVPNYVKYLCDHVRSIIAGMGKRHTIAEIKAKSVDLIRDAILGTKPTGSPDASEPLHTTRPGLFFEDNGMRVIEVEVLPDDEGSLVTIGDPAIASLLDQAQTEVVKANIQLDRGRKDLEATIEQEKIKQAKADATHKTNQLQIELNKQLIGDQLSLAMAQFEAEIAKIERQAEQQKQSEALTDISFEAQQQRLRAEKEQQLAFEAKEQELQVLLLTEETKAAVERFQAAKDGLYEVLVSLGRDEMAAKFAEACTIERYLSGDSIGSSIANLLSVVPTLQQFMDKGEEIQKARGNGSNRLREQTANS